jgi:dCMP deaminase
VGAVAIKENNIIAYGFNGTPRGMDNNCEDEQGETKPEVLHAELNLICKCAKSGISLDGAIIYITLSPCLNCAKLILQCGIKEVIYTREHSNQDGVHFLNTNGVKTKYFPC